MKEIIKRIIKSLPLSFTQNQKYDVQTKSVIQKVCTTTSNCVDVGCHKGEILEIFLKHAPEGHHFAFEPIPSLYQRLINRFGSSVKVFPYALSDTGGKTTFNHVVSNPSYSGIIKRSYDRAGEIDEQIEVEMAPMDDVVSESTKIDLIKIDVEGGEYAVLKGATRIINRCRPIIIFEHGLGASDFYQTSPDDVYLFFKELDYSISTMEDWLKRKGSFSQADFSRQFYQKLNYYFIAYPNGSR